MKKALLLTGALLAASSMMAQDATGPSAIQAPMTYVMGVSQNGRYAVSDINGMLLQIYDLDTNSSIGDYIDQEYGYNSYIPGYGRCVANDGSVVGNAVLYDIDEDAGTYTSTDNAVIFREGELVILNVPDTTKINMAHAITPDGSVICGNVGAASFSIDFRSVMQVPAVWYLQDDGTYGDPVLLPHPEKDFMGGVPQYVTAINISEDGNVIAGTVTANNGWYIYPIIYTRDVLGRWSYYLPNQDLFRNADVVIPENPGDDPSMKDFMSAEELEAYNQAMEEWNNTPWSERDWNNYPNQQNYLTDEEKAAYNAALEKWTAESAAYQSAVAAATAGCINFTYNNVCLSPDGKYYASTAAGQDSGILLAPSKKGPKYNPARVLKKDDAADDDFGGVAGDDDFGVDTGDDTTGDDNTGDDNTGDDTPAAPTVNTPYVLNLVDGTYVRYDSEGGTMVSCAGPSGTFVGYTGSAMNYDMAAYVMSPETGLIPLQEYFQTNAPELATWLVENCTHTVSVYNWETGEESEQEMLLSGQPYCSTDMNVIACTATQIWDQLSDYYGYPECYIYKNVNKPSAVKNVATTANQLTVIRGGYVKVNGEATIEVIALDGTSVFKGHTNGVVATGVKGGIYIVRATFADGKVRTAKVNF